MDEKHPNRKKDKHNPYTLMIVEGRYYLSFKDGRGVVQNIEIDKVLYIAVFPRIMKTKRIHLKASSAISSNISSATQIGSCMRFLPMKAFLERAQKSVKSLTE